MSSGFTPTLLPDAAALWRSALGHLSPYASPCRYLAPTKWAAVRENAISFCDQFGAEAHRLGWTARELFAVRSQHGTLRVDYCGALMVGTDPARDVEADRVSFERTSAYRSRPVQERGIPIWEFAKMSAGR